MKQLYNQLSIRGVAMNKAYKIHYLEPNFASIFSYYNVSEIAFLRLNYYEIRGGEKTVESMKHSHQTAYQLLLESTENQKSVNFELLGFRLNSDYYPYSYYVNEDIPIKAKTDGKSGMLSAIKKEMIRYEMVTN
jgi:hypothetical protein